MKHLEGFKHLKSGYSESVWKDDIQYIEDISKIASDEGRRRGDQIIRMVDNPLHYKDKKVATFKFTIYQTRQPKLFKKY